MLANEPRRHGNIAYLLAPLCALRFNFYFDVVDMTTNYLLLVLEQLLRLGRDVHVDAPVLQLPVLEDEEALLRLRFKQRAEERLAGALGGGLRLSVFYVERRAAHVATDELRVLEGFLFGLQQRILAAAALRRRRGERAVREASY